MSIAATSRRIDAATSATVRSSTLPPSPDIRPSVPQHAPVAPVSGPPEIVILTSDNCALWRRTEWRLSITYCWPSTRRSTRLV